MGILKEFTAGEPISKGWSGDRKYCAVTADGTKYLLRMTSAEKEAGRAEMFRLQRQAADLGAPVCRPVEFGICREGVYTVETWIDGEDAETVIPALPEERQYAYGLESGYILRKIHTIPAPETQEDWEPRFNRKIDRKMRKYAECPIRYENGQAFIDYINENRHLLKGRPQVFQHGDYHIGNMMIDRDGKLRILDFDRYDFGDPWEEFNRIVWCAQKSPLFASGMLDGYFDGDIPPEFWKLLALYIASNTLTSVSWAIPFGQDEVDKMLNQANDILRWYDLMRTPVPAWYSRRENGPERAKALERLSAALDAARETGEPRKDAGDPDGLLWETLTLFQGDSFRTAKGLDFTYRIKGNEMFIDRKNKSVTRATVMLSFHNALRLGGKVSGPKMLNTFGASYLYPIFRRFGIIRTGEAE